MSAIKLKNIVWKEGRHYVAQCLNVDVSSFGKTYEQSLKNLEDALELYLENQPSKKRLLSANPPHIGWLEF